MVLAVFASSGFLFSKVLNIDMYPEGGHASFILFPEHFWIVVNAFVKGNDTRIDVS